MKFLVDECTGPGVAKWLETEGHEVFSVFKEAKGISDNEILRIAFEENWILITNDNDFGIKVYRDQHPHHGIILLRLEDERVENKIVVLKKLLANYSTKIPYYFTVVTEKKVRFS